MSVCVCACVCVCVRLSVEKVPVELREPFYCDQYEQEHLKPPVTRLLLSSELYCRTYTLLVGGSAPEGAPPPDNAALLQLLADRGLPPTDLDAPVGDADLRRKPIKMVMCVCVCVCVCVWFLRKYGYLGSTK